MDKLSERLWNDVLSKVESEVHQVYEEFRLVYNIIYSTKTYLSIKYEAENNHQNYTSAINSETDIKTALSKFNKNLNLNLWN